MNILNTKLDILNVIKADIIGLCETYLQGNESLEIDGYQWFGQNRDGINARARRGSGGVGFLVKSDILNDFNFQIVDASYQGILWGKLSAKTSDLVLITAVFYLPPEKSVWANADTFFNTLTSQIYKFQNEGFITIGGDFNARCGQQEDYIEGSDDICMREIIDFVENSHGDHLTDFLISTNIAMLNGRKGSNDYTCVSHRGKSVVDYILTPYEQLGNYTAFQVLPISDIINTHNIPVVDNMLSKLDHSVLMCNFNIDPWCLTDYNRKGDYNQKGECIKYKRNEIPENFLQNKWSVEIQQSIARIERILSVENDINKGYTELAELVKQHADDKVPKITVNLGGAKSKVKKRKNVEYWNHELEREWRNVCLLEKQWRACRNNQVQEKRGVFKLARQRFDKHLRKTRRSYQSTKQERMVKVCDNDVNTFWKDIDSIKMGIAGNRKQRIPIEIEEGGTIVTDTEKVLNRWRRDFKNIYQNIGNGQFDEDHLAYIEQRVDSMEREYQEMVREHNEDIHGINHIDILNQPLTLDEVRKAVLRAKKRKAVGLDELPAELLQNETAIEILYRIFTHCFENATIPSIWQEGIIHPIFKPSNSDIRDPLHYRGITLMCASYKMYCDILNTRLSKWLEDNNLLADEQNGFRALRSCIDHVYALYSIINNRMLKKSDTFCCYIDVKKAFDSVNRKCLRYKMLSMGINGKIYQALNSLYDNYRCTVRINNMYTEHFDIPNGLKQGCVVSPTFFKIYINDLVTDINNHEAGITIDNRNISMLMFADDIVLLAPTEDKLQEMLDIVNNWCSKWRLTLNGTKTEIIHYRHKSKERSAFQFKCGELNLQYTDKYKYLGVWLHEHLDLSVTVKEISKSATRALGKVISIFKNTGGSSHKIFIKLFNTAILPIITYSAGIWGLHEFKKLNTILNKAGRFLLGLTPKTPNIATQGEMGWNSIIYHTRKEVIRLFCRLQNMSDNRVTKKSIHGQSYKAVKTGLTISRDSC